MNGGIVERQAAGARVARALLLVLAVLLLFAGWNVVALILFIAAITDCRVSSFVVVAVLGSVIAGLYVVVFL